MDLKQAIEILESNNWCSLRLITANVKKGSGGQVLEIPKCKIARNTTLSAASGEAITNDLAGQKQGVRAGQFTRNVQLPNKQIRTIHPILITHINQEAVL